MDLRGRDVRAVAVGAVVALVLAGCNGDPEVEVTPTPTPVETVAESPSPTPSPSPTALTEEEVLAAIPELANEESLDGAFSFAERFMEESRLLFAKSDPRLFEAMSSPSCTFCKNVVEHFNEIRLAEHSFSGGQIEVVSQIPQGGLQGDGTWHLEFEIEVNSSVVTSTGGEVIAEAPKESYFVAVLLERVGDFYQVVDVGSDRASS